MKVAQRRQDLGCRLNFVEEEQGFARPNPGLVLGLQQCHRFRRRTRGEKRGIRWIVLEIQFYQIGEFRGGKQLYEPGLPDLPSASHNHGLAGLTCFPRLQVCECLPNHRQWVRDRFQEEFFICTNFEILS